MRIATWNIERLKHEREIDAILCEIKKLKADIFVLTETDARISLDYRNAFHTTKLTEGEKISYKPTENRVSIFTNYECVRKHTTYDENKALCVELETERGNLLVYGTIIGIYGNRHPSFRQDLLSQVDDWNRLAASEANICICRDFNCSFGDNYYFTQFGRDTMNQLFAEKHIKIITSGRNECIDHVAISESFVTESEILITEWNQNKSLSDHKGIAVELVY